MIYILIFVLSQYQKPTPAAAIEFKSLAACQAAAAEIRKQAQAEREGWRVPILMCAPKGVVP